MGGSSFFEGSDSFRLVLHTVMAPLVDGWDYGQWLAVYNALSFGIAGMGSATIFFWIEMGSMQKKFRTALIITGLVTAIATYHYVRISTLGMMRTQSKLDQTGTTQ